MQSSAFLHLLLALASLLVRADDKHSKCTPLTPKQLQRAEQAARQWAPLVWLAPGEEFFPSSALDFLAHTRLGGASSPRDSATPAVDAATAEKLARESPPLEQTLPSGVKSRNKFLETIDDLDVLLANKSSFIYGHTPHFFSVPVYAVVSSCCPRKLRHAAPRYLSKRTSQNSLLGQDENTLSDNEVNKDSESEEQNEFEVTFWLFFPYSEGKRVCTVTAGAFGPLPFPWLRTACLGSVKTYGSHVGDWEHVTLAFKGSGAPTAMYVSTHDAGALYSAPPTSRDTRDGERSPRLWTYSGHELRRGGRLQNPRFPRRAVTLRSGRPVLFAARGSHGLWTLPGRHKYVTFPNLEDETGFGASWRTWQNLQVIPWPPPSSSPRWLTFEGRWGNTRSGCHPLSQQVCHVTDGPGGIPTKKHAFRCLNTLPQLALPLMDVMSSKSIFIKRISVI